MQYTKPFENKILPNLYSKRVVELIREFILNGGCKPGDWLRESELVEQLEVSRSPIREALQRLELEGLVQLVPYKGAYVTKLTLTEIRELGEVREALEVKAVSLACERATESDLNDLEAFLALSEKALSSNRYSEYPWNFDFHNQLARCSGNSVLAGKIYEIGARLLLTRFESGSKKGRARKAFVEHQRIFQALKERNASKAVKRVREHIQAFVRMMDDSRMGGDNS